MQVYLIGFMGAGKTTLGKRLAGRLDTTFVDMDKAIEEEEKMRVEEIFAQKGEDYFRELEKNWIKKINDKQAVISLGGGTPCQEDVMKVLRQKGVPVYLKVDNGILTTRLMQSKTVRPLIAPFKNDPEKMRNFVNEKVAEREKFYLQSKLIFESSDVKSEKLELLKDLILVLSDQKSTEH
ncbi:MAG: shikimate kinase [Crocinitomicaceae bacterium]|nr:shikimate kinase [Crocinitomicaceae bacterium]